MYIVGQVLVLVVTAIGIYGTFRRNRVLILLAMIVWTLLAVLLIWLIPAAFAPCLVTSYCHPGRGLALTFLLLATVLLFLSFQLRFFLELSYVQVHDQLPDIEMGVAASALPIPYFVNQPTPTY